MNKVVRLAVCLQFGFLALLAGAATLPPIYVDPQRGNDEENDGSEQAPFKTLDKGVEVIGKERHLALYLAPGTYKLNANVTFGLDTHEGENNNPRLVGLTGNPDDVIIDGQGKYWWHQSTQTRGICSVTFSNLYASATQALLLDKDLPVDYDETTVRVFSNCVVTCCKAASSELIAVFGRTAMRDCRIRNCTVTGSGKCVLVAKGGAQIDVCEFSDNVTAGPVVELTGYNSMSKAGLCKCHVKDAIFLRNQAKTVVHQVPVVDSCLFLTNTTVESSCLYPQNFSFGAPLRMLNSVFEGNVTSGATGCSGVNLQNATITNSLIENCVFANGSAPNATGASNCHGGAIRLLPSGLQGAGLVLRNVRISGMTNGPSGTKSEGSAVAVLFKPDISGTGTVAFENCSFVDNQLRDYEYYGAKVAGAVHVSEKNNTRVAFTNCVFSNVRENGSYEHGVKFTDNVPYALMGHCLFRTATGYAFAPEQENLNGFDPQFEAGSYVPSAKSPLVDAGRNNTAWMTTAYDLQRKPDGTLIGKPFRKRIVNDIVDIGAYEYRADPGLMLMLR